MEGCYVFLKLLLLGACCITRINGDNDNSSQAREGEHVSQQRMDWPQLQRLWLINCSHPSYHNLDLALEQRIITDTQWTDGKLDHIRNMLRIDTEPARVTEKHLKLLIEDEQRVAKILSSEKNWVKRTTNLPLRLDKNIGPPNRKLMLAMEKRELARVYSSLAMVLLDSDPVQTRQWEKVRRVGHRMVKKHCDTRTVLNPTTTITRLVTSAVALTSSVNTKRQLVDDFVRQKSATWNRIEKRHFAEFLLNYSQKLRKVALKHL